MTTFASGLMGAVYVDGVLLEFITSAEINIDRDVAEEAVMGQEYKIKRVGAYGGEFSGSALVDMDSSVLFDEVISVSTTTSVISIYPDRTDVTTYWYGNGQFSTWSASASPGDLWSGDYSGVFTDQIYEVGFET